MAKPSKNCCSGSRNKHASECELSLQAKVVFFCFHLLVQSNIQLVCMTTFVPKVWCGNSGLWEELDKWSCFPCSHQVHRPHPGRYEEGLAENCTRKSGRCIQDCPLLFGYPTPPGAWRCATVFCKYSTYNILQHRIIRIPLCKGVGNPELLDWGLLSTTETWLKPVLLNFFLSCPPP